jgi:hypothetical protein
VHETIRGQSRFGDGLVLMQAEGRCQFVEHFACCFTGLRFRDSSNTPLVDLLKQRIFAMYIAHEQFNDH